MTWEHFHEMPLKWNKDDEVDFISVYEGFDYYGNGEDSLKYLLGKKVMRMKCP